MGFLVGLIIGASSATFLSIAVYNKKLRKKEVLIEYYKEIGDNYKKGYYNQLLESKKMKTKE